MKHIKTPVLSNIRISRDLYELRFCWPGDSGIPRPGQFLTVRVHDGPVPFLRRPFAFSRYDEPDSSAAIIYQIRGSATGILAGKHEGEKLDIIGPLGNGFALPQKRQRPIVVAGGIGLGPMLFLAQRLAAAISTPLFVFGCRTVKQVPGCDSFNDVEPVLCTDDGSRGFSGTVVDYLESLDIQEVRETVLYCCGPTAMLRACHEFGERNGIECFVSVEQVMACGVGACMGCVVKVNYGNGYARACKEGPVFSSRDIIWN